MTSPATPRGVRVMIVEDDRDVRVSLVQVLEEEGYETLQADNGRAGVAQLRGGGPLPHLILLDMMMPKMDGHEFLLQQSADANLAAIPVLVLSASDSARRDAVVPGLTTVFLKKPFGLEILLSNIDRLCVHHHRRDGGDGPSEG